MEKKILKCENQITTLINEKKQLEEDNKNGTKELVKVINKLERCLESKK